MSPHALCSFWFDTTPFVDPISAQHRMKWFHPSPHLIKAVILRKRGLSKTYSFIVCVIMSKRYFEARRGEHLNSSPPQDEIVSSFFPSESGPSKPEFQDNAGCLKSAHFKLALLCQNVTWEPNVRNSLSSAHQTMKWF